MFGKAEVKQAPHHVLRIQFSVPMLFTSPHLQPSLSAGVLPSAAFLVAVSYVGCNHILTVTFLTLGSTIGGASASGVFMNQIDIAPR